MRKFWKLVLCCFIQFVAIIGFIVGCNYVPPLVQVVRAAMTGQPWQLPELARLVACVSGPGLIGAGLTAGLYWFIIAQSRLQKRVAAFPDQPWLWREDWQAKQIRLSNRAAVGFLTAATLAYLLILMPLGIYLASLKNAWMVYTFLAVLALFLLLFIWRQWINRIRNRSVLNFETLPGRINGDFSGRAIIPLSFREGTVFHVRLRCELTVVNHARSGNTDDAISVLTNTQNRKSQSVSHASTVYDDTRLVTPAVDHDVPGSTTVPVLFGIPNNLPPTGTTFESAGADSNTAVTRHSIWTVRIRLNTESDLREIVFEVPVFDVKQ